VRKRTNNKGLANSRIYQKGNRLYLFSATPIENPDTGKIAKWHPLCDADEGEMQARIKAQSIIRHNTPDRNTGDLPAHIEIYRVKILKKRQADKPKDPQRAKLHEEATREISRQCKKIAEAFVQFDVEQVMPVDIAQYIDQWEGQRMAQVWHSRLSDFFTWCCRKGLRNDNPCREVKVEKPKSRARYITDQEFFAAYDSLLTGLDNKPTPSGPMVQCYVDLLYLLYQRTTDIRLLKRSEVTEKGIGFIPTKTERSSGANVFVPMTPAIKSVIDRANSIGQVKSMYIIHKPNGQPYSTRGLGSAWKRACQRAGIENATLKDIRAKALTDAKAAGYEKKQLMIAAAHTDEETTDGYIRLRERPVSEVMLSLPKRKQ
jgi:site-specific recombinase XerD